jgi:crotonobetainyl-CoA:carnitine CoA-transferase CaiB-like acyl-CoA transferase
MRGYDFFVEGQSRGIPVTLVNAPEDVMADPHMIERGFPVAVAYPDRNAPVIHPGAPYRLHATPWRITRAPRLGEHQAAVFDALR